MPTGQGVPGGPSGFRRISPVEFLLLTERSVREARTAQATAIGDAIVRAFAAAVRGGRLLSSICHGAFALPPNATCSRTIQPD